ncbi:choice-of-anchor tandem repeat GloVer-containing protein [Chlamydiota bacterium]
MKNNVKRQFRTIIILLFIGLVISLFFVNADDITILYNFGEGGAGDGATPHGSVTIYNGTMYGMTGSGGSGDHGVIFSMDIGDTSSYSILHTFAGGANDGDSPWGSLIVSDNIMYGMTNGGGDAGDGVVFSMNVTDTSSFSLLHEFDSGTDGRRPDGDLLLMGNTLYGMTSQGGDENGGIIFSVSTTGTNFNTLFEFTSGSGPGDTGHRPWGSALTFVNDKFYGMTADDGPGGYGTVFSVDTDGNNFDVVHSFSSGADDGENPHDNLIYYNGRLYGMTENGGDSGSGVIFSMNTDGTDFSLLFEFKDNVEGYEGKSPYGHVTISDDGTTLYGLTLSGGVNGDGVFFSINNDGTGFSLIHEFGTGSDGSSPKGNNVVLYNNKLYGMTTSGGTYGDGIIFEYELQGDPIPEPSTIILILLSFLGLIGKHVKKKHSSKGG